jgi:patatin-like phospholipase/acyl hydrolase
MNTVVPRYRILSIDGGGLRGIIPLAIMERLDAAVPGWRTDINMFAGTSTGGLIALCLARGMSPSDILNVYVEQGASIFARSLWQEIKTLDEAIGPKYDSANRENVCKHVMGTTRLSDLRSADGKKGHVVIPSFDLDDKTEQNPNARRWKAKVFHNMPTRDGSGDDLEYAYRVAMRTSAAPTYFASYDGFVDGGVFANNPSMCALAQTQDKRLVNIIPFTDIRMMSISTGVYPYHLDGDESWGLAQWAPKLADLLTDGVNEVSDFQTAQMMDEQTYCRIPLQLIADIKMDDASEIGTLQRIGNAVDIGKASDFLTRFFV